MQLLSLHKTTPKFAPWLWECCPNTSCILLGLGLRHLPGEPEVYMSTAFGSVLEGTGKLWLSLLFPLLPLLL